MVTTSPVGIMRRSGLEDETGLGGGRGGGRPDHADEEEVGLLAGEALEMRPEAAGIAPPLRLAAVPTRGVGAIVQPHAVLGAVDLDPPLGSAAGGADGRPPGRAGAPPLALGAERAGGAHARRLTPAGPCS